MNSSSVKEHSSSANISYVRNNSKRSDDRGGMFGKTWHSTDCLTMHVVVIKLIALSEAVINVARLTIDFFFARIETENYWTMKFLTIALLFVFLQVSRSWIHPFVGINFNDDKSLFRYSTVSSLNWNRKVRENYLSNERMINAVSFINIFEKSYNERTFDVHIRVM